MEKLQKKIDNYIEWYRTDCCDTYGELEWLIKTLLDSKHKEDMESILNDTYELYSGNFEDDEPEITGIPNGNTMSDTD